MTAGEQIVFTAFDEAKEDAVREYERTALDTWARFGVKEITLNEEFVSWRWKTIATRIGRKSTYHEVIEWYGLGITIAEQLEKHKLAILGASSTEELGLRLTKAKHSIHAIACYLWSLNKATGLNTTDILMRKAQKAESLAEYHERRGADHIAEGQRERAELLRRKARGEDVELPQRASGAIQKVRAIYAEMEKDGQKSRNELIKAATDAGIHPGTAAVQYARWRREQRQQ